MPDSALTSRPPRPKHRQWPLPSTFSLKKTNNNTSLPPLPGLTGDFAPAEGAGASAIVKRLYKKQKLCSTVAIDMLFASGAGTHRALAYPLRAVWRENPGRRCDAELQMLISIPKKRLRHAVDRVKMRRRVREAFRLNHQNHPMPAGSRVDMAFIYVGSGLESYAAVEQAVCRLLDKAAASINAHRTSASPETTKATPSPRQ